MKYPDLNRANLSAAKLAVVYFALLVLSLVLAA